ncbi:MAG: SurA N-terminal domain-containing protein [Pseudomonadota bacterium]
MLKSFRGAVKGVGAWIVVGLFVIAFSFVGVPALNNFSSSDAIAVGDTRYSVEDLRSKFARSIERQRLTQGEVLSPQEAIEAGLLDQTITAMAQEALFIEEAETLGLTVSDEMLQQYFQNAEGLQNPNTGKFDREVLSTLLRNMNMSLTEFRELARNELYRRQIDDAIGLGGPAPKTLANMVILREAEERVVSFTTLTAPDIPSPDEAALQSFYASTAEDYQTPEYREYNMILLDRAAIEPRVDVTEEDLRQLFESRSNQLDGPARRSFTQAQFDTVEAAQSALDSINQGEDFRTVAEAAGATIASLENQERSALVDEKVADAIFGVNETGIVGPIEGEFGVLLVEIENVVAGVKANFADYKDQLEIELKEELYADQLDILFETVQEAGDNGLTLEDVTGETGLTLRVVGPVDRNFLTPEGAIEDDIPLQAHLAAFAKSPEGLFEAVELEDGASVFVEVKSVIPSRTRSYDEVTDDVRTAYLKDRQRTALQDQREAFEQALSDGTSFEEAATGLGGNTQSQTLSFRSPADPLPPSLVQQLFNRSIGETAHEISEDQTSVIVARVDNISFAPNPQADFMLAALQPRLGSTLLNDYYNAYLLAMQDDHVVTQNDAAIAASIGNEQ